MNPELEKLIDIAAKGAVITDRQKELIFKKAVSFNEDPDEVEFLLDLKYKEYHKQVDESTVSHTLFQQNIDDTNNAYGEFRNFIKEYKETVPSIVRAGIMQTRSGNGKRKKVAVLLALFLGWLGIHKFYMGNIKAGILYILFSWTIIPAILGWIDAFVILFESDEQFYAQIKSTL